MNQTIVIEDPIVGKVVWTLPDDLADALNVVQDIANEAGMEASVSRNFSDEIGELLRVQIGVIAIATTLSLKHGDAGEFSRYIDPIRKLNDKQLPRLMKLLQKTGGDTGSTSSP